jgi:hypothetical protein
VEDKDIEKEKERGREGRKKKEIDNGQTYADRTNPWPSFQLYDMLVVWRALIMQYLAIQPNVELKTWSKQLLGCLPFDIELPGQIEILKH